MQLTPSNQLTILRALAAIVYVPVVMIDDQLARLLALLLFTLAGFSDYYDGHMARLRKEQSDFGVLADPLADKLLTGVCFVSLSWLQPRLVPWWMTIVILIREIGITIWRLAELRQGRVLAPDRWGKWKTGLQMTAIPCALLATALFSGEQGREWQAWFEPTVAGRIVFGFCWGLTFITTLLTVTSGGLYLWRNRGAAR